MCLSTMSDGTFLVSISGQLEYIDTFAEAGSDWYSGLSQICSVNSNGGKVVLNLPIEFMVKSTNIYGWPQVVFSVYKNVTLGGYGRCHIPLTPGVHSLNIALSKPLTSTFFGSIASFFGYQPELIQPEMLATTAGNHLLRMTATGQVKATINIITQGFTSLGYDAGQAR
ncbi:B9 domain-containing protein 1-like isoform X2 [Coccinella septempunctata]|uniref:B9 domain-containing protein 1-like isoform X2 n=1 Tax=Coccinella septempunctata TaxID=41139 RepID=UPI001D05F28D|nr:B9 domain-containing protein 1-like isoform X2 [Coccinella septempunctata]